MPEHDPDTRHDSPADSAPDDAASISNTPGADAGNHDTGENADAPADSTPSDSNNAGMDAETKRDVINLREVAQRRGLVAAGDDGGNVSSPPDAATDDDDDDSDDDDEDEDEDEDAGKSGQKPSAGKSAASACTLEPARLKRYCEAVLFRSPSPIKSTRIAKLVGYDARPGDVNRALNALKEDYDALGLSFEPVRVAGGWQLVTRPEYAEVIEKMVVQREAKKLTPTMLETLAIIAFKQPLTRQQIDDVRGVDSGGVLRNLMDRGLVSSGRDYNTLGKPIVYSTTQKFLRIFGLKSLRDLPRAVDFRNSGD